MSYEFLKKNYSIHKNVYDYIEDNCNELKEVFEKYEKIKEFNQLKVLNIFAKNKLAQSDFSYTTGYGYGDIGRDKTEKIFADIFKTEDAIVRPIISSGTHAISLVLTAILSKDDIMISITDDPYDTLLEVIGIKGNEYGNLISNGVIYKSIKLINNRFDKEKIKENLKLNPKMVYIQRSTGYGLKRAITISEIEEIIKFIRNINKEVIIMVDNCYGEFVEDREPTEVGADICAGSLIKNAGGSIALSGGYIVSSKKYISMISNRLYAPGIGKETGLSFDMTRSMLQGLFFAPHIIYEAVKSSLLFCKTYSKLGYDVYPKMKDNRSDIIQAIVFNNEEKLIKFVQSIQKAASVGSNVIPYPWDMPGYSNQIIMASGGFVDGSSIEISADGPLREPFAAYYQGGVVFEQAKLACMLSIQNLNENLNITN